jgi:GNAT superfamily N-acetyltransferase
MEIRQATLEDRQIFVTLWKDFMVEREKLGGAIEVCDENLLAYLSLFESYIAGSLFGFTLLAFEDEEPVGALLMGEYPPSGFNMKTKNGKTITAWGVYVRPEHRRSGIAWALQDEARVLGRRLGFDTVLSYIMSGDPVGQANALNWGFEVIESLMVFPLESSEHGKQRNKQ